MAEEEFLITGLSPSHALALVAINYEPGLSQNELSKRLNIKTSTTTRFIDKLESKGFVTRRVEGKSSYLHPTEEGMKLEKEIEKCWKNLHNHYSRILGYEEGENLTSIVYEAAGKLEKDLK